jgi:hypothetical protein
VSAEVLFAVAVMSITALILSPFLHVVFEPIETTLVSITLAVASIAFMLAAIKLWSQGTMATQEIRWLARDVGFDDAYPLRITIRQDGHVTGIDDGIAYFAKDTLCFHGLQCDFSIGAQDLRYGPHMIHTPHGSVESGYVIPAITLRHPERSISIFFEPYTRMCKKDERDCAYRFRRDLRLFLHNWRPSHEPSLYPPLENHPNVASLRRKAAIIDSGQPARH